MRISELRDLITIQDEVRTPDGQGGFERSFTNTEKVWAKVEPLFQIEAMIAGQTDSGAILKATVRASSAVKATSRIVYQGENYRVAGAIKRLEGGRRWLEFQLRGEHAAS